MNTRYKRSIRRRIISFCEDCRWYWDTHGDALMTGFVAGALSVVFGLYCAWGLLCG